MKVAVVTGSAKGLGKDVALALAKDGWTLVTHYNRSKGDAEKVLSEIKKVSPDSISVNGDLTKEDQVLRVFEDVYNKFGHVDLLVNNVGNFLYKKFGNTTNSEFKDVMETNVNSTLFCSRAVLGEMRKQKSGQIVNIGTVGCERIVLRENSTPYFMAKSGVYMLTKTMAWEEAAHGIRINMISPGSMATDIFKEEDFPSGRPGKHDDVIRALMFLISPENSYINGANLEVAGGFIPGM